MLLAPVSESVVPGSTHMTNASQVWLAGLLAHTAAARPQAGGGESSSAAFAAERCLLAAQLVVWLDTELAGLLAERSATCEPGSDPEPAIVLTTTTAGLAAAADLLNRDDPLMRQWREQFACVTELEYRRWCMLHPDHDYRRHIAHWSWMKTRVPPRWWPRFARWPLNTGECYWLHRTGTAGAGEDRRASHLWKWNGTTASLLKAFVDEGLRDS
jgi:hypothetical protein